MLYLHCISNIDNSLIESLKMYHSSSSANVVTCHAPNSYKDTANQMQNIIFHHCPGEDLLNCLFSSVELNQMDVWIFGCVTTPCSVGVFIWFFGFSGYFVYLCFPGLLWLVPVLFSKSSFFVLSVCVHRCFVFSSSWVLPNTFSLPLHQQLDEWSVSLGVTCSRLGYPFFFLKTWVTW